MVVYRGKTPYKECIVCGYFFQTKKSHLTRRKTCSRSCSGYRKKTMYIGESNPNFGNRGELNPMYKGEFINNLGYKEIHRPNHPNANKAGYVLEHRYIASQILGRPLTDEEVVHHIDEDRLNNSPNNLQVMSRGDHTKLHMRDYEIVRDSLGRIVSSIRKRSRDN